MLSHLSVSLFLLQAKDRQKKKRERVTKGIRVDDDGDVTLEDFNKNAAADGAEQEKDDQSKKKVFLYFLDDTGFD